MLRLILAFGLACIIVSPALAQVDGSSIFGAWRPYIVELAGIVIAALVGWLANLVRRRLGLEIEAKHRDALQTALTNAAGLAIAKGEQFAAGLRLDTRNPAINEAIDYVLKSAPDALRYFGLTPEALREKITAKVGALTATPANA